MLVIHAVWHKSLVIESMILSFVFDEFSRERWWLSTLFGTKVRRYNHRVCRLCLTDLVGKDDGYPRCLAQKFGDRINDFVFYVS